jgi:glycosyltransferase involved in cell wall biosynthesis
LVQICLVSLDYKPYRSSGLTIYAEDLARGLADLGHGVTVLAARRPGLPAHQRLDGIDVYRAPLGLLNWCTYSWRAAGLLRRLEEKRRFQVVHFLDVHFAWAYHRPFVASLWQSFRQILTACNGRPCHTGLLDRLRRETYYRIARRFMERPSLARAGRLVAACQSTRSEFISHYRVPPEKIDLAVQGIDTGFFRPVPAGDLRRRLGLDGCQVLLFVGFVTPRKGLEYLARAMRLLPENVHLVVAGRWAPACQSRFVAALGPAAARVHQVGFVADEDRPTYYSMADLYVSPSLLEGLGITPIEAMACGTPAIVTSASSGPEEVGDAGVIVPPGDPQVLAAAIQGLLDDGDLRAQLGRRGRERVLSEFSYRRMAGFTVRTYERFLQATIEGAG